MNTKLKYLLSIGLLLILCFLLYKSCLSEKLGSKKEFPDNTLQGHSEISAGFLRLKIWDNDAEDGDTIKVYLDGKLIKDNLGILNMPVVVELKNLKTGEHILGVEAVDEGMSSPATATLCIYNEVEKKEFEMNATKEKPASWKITVK